MLKLISFSTCRKLCVIQHQVVRQCSSGKVRTGLLLGLYKDKDASKLTKASADLLKSDPALEGIVNSLLNAKFKPHTTRIVYQQAGYDAICFTNIGNPTAGYDDLEEVNLCKENVRTAIFKGVSHMRDLGIQQVDIDCCADPKSAAEGAYLAQFAYDDLKTEKQDKLDMKPYRLGESGAKLWQHGVIYAEAQNLARWLMEAPSNVLTPSKFAQIASERLPDACSVTMNGYDWIEKQKMAAFLAVAKGSDEEPVFLQIEYNGINDGSPALAIVGKGVTFDSGGISLKPAAKMEEMRADMGGAACSLAAIWAAAKLQLPLNIRVYIPLCENMPSGKATKPGDVVVTRSGKTVQIDNTDAEGRLLLADALHYACEQKPACVLDLATLTGAMRVALGAGPTGVFSNSQQLWTALHEAGKLTGDRVWRMPLFKLYASQMKKAPLADLNNIGIHTGSAGACTAAAFLLAFVNCKHWCHLDIAGVMDNRDEVPYLSKGMAGRPTRTIIQMLEHLKIKDFQ